MELPNTKTGLTFCTIWACAVFQWAQSTYSVDLSGLHVVLKTKVINFVFIIPSKQDLDLV